MDAFAFNENEAYCENVRLSEVAKKFGTPLYVYSKNSIEENCKLLQSAMSPYPTLPFYAMKANENLSVLRIIFGNGLGVEAVSVGELEKALVAGFKSDRILLAGVGKRDDEIARALEVGLFALSVESIGELPQIARLAKVANKTARVSLRINPNIAVKTNPHISTGLHTNKFGIAELDLPDAQSELKKHPHLKLVGISCHLGSQIVDLAPFVQAAERMVQIATQLKGAGFPLEYLSLGGGVGIRYTNETAPSMREFAELVHPIVKKSGLKLVLEPGRWIVGNSGILLTRVVMTKSTPVKKFVVVDAGMNDLLRPCLYDAHHVIEAVAPGQNKKETVDVVGPVCESADFLGRDRSLSEMKIGDLLFVRSCGAYAASMGSNYNGRPRPAEVLVDGKEYTLIRRREKISDMWVGEL